MTFDQSLFLYLSALALGAQAAGFARHGGSSSFGLEGVMLLGGLAGLLFSFLSPWLCLLIAGCAGMLCALPLAWASRRHPGHGVLTGMAFNGFAAALAMILARVSGGVHYSRRAFSLEFGAVTLPLFVPVTLGLLLLSRIFLQHTRLGLRLRLGGAAPEAAENALIRPSLARYACLLCFGFLGGVGGTAGLIALGSNWTLQYGLGGLGFFALAAARPGRKHPLTVFLAVLFLSLLCAGGDCLSPLFPAVPPEVFRLLPLLGALLCARQRENKGN